MIYSASNLFGSLFHRFSVIKGMKGWSIRSENSMHSCKTEKAVCFFSSSSPFMIVSRYCWKKLIMEEMNHVRDSIGHLILNETSCREFDGVIQPFQDLWISWTKWIQSNNIEIDKILFCEFGRILYLITEVSIWDNNIHVKIRCPT